MTMPECLDSTDPDAHDWLRIERDGLVVEIRCTRCGIWPVELLKHRRVVPSAVGSAVGPDAPTD